MQRLWLGCKVSNAITLTLEIPEVKHVFCVCVCVGGGKADNVYIIGAFLTKFYVVLCGAHLCEKFSSYFRFYNSYCKTVFSRSHLLFRCARDTHRVVYTTEEWMFPKAILTISSSSSFDLNGV